MISLKWSENIKIMRSNNLQHSNRFSIIPLIEPKKKKNRKLNAIYTSVKHGIT